MRDGVLNQRKTHNQATPKHKKLRNKTNILRLFNNRQSKFSNKTQKSYQMNTF